MISNSSRARTGVAYLVLVIYVVINAFPLLWMISTSIKPPEEVYVIPPRWIPLQPTIANYRSIFQASNFGQYVLNSVIVTLATTALCIVLGTMAAYSFSRFRVRRSSLLLMLVLVSRMIAPVALVVPFFLIARKLGLVDTKTILVISNLYMQLPLFIWMMKGFLDGISRELDEAALIDGCSQFEVFYRLIVPLSKPGIAAFGILVFLFTWNDFLFALTLSIGDASKTLTVGMMDFFQDTQVLWPELAAAGTIGVIPALIFVAFCQKYLVRGILQGSIKG